MISSSDRSRLCSIDRRKYKGQGPVKYNDVRMRDFFLPSFFLSLSVPLTLCLKTMSYVLWQMVNVHERWTHTRERKRIGDDDDASLWPSQRRQQIELAIMCLSSCLAQANERKGSVGQVVSRSIPEQDYVFPSLSLDDRVREEWECDMQFFFHHRFSFLLELCVRACADRVHQLALNDDERFRILFFSSRRMILCSTTSKNERKNE